ncbi:MAG: hypothetical protein FWF05_00825 [Oscillospiraceae bacterium]|nr:hypothetical protein [Oscillospiraceae bacterium]
MNTKSKYYAGSFPQRTATFFTAKNGLPSDAILALALDKNNVLYAGTEKGLSRFDGEAFTKVKLGGGPEAVGVLYRDREGTVWAGAGDTVYSVENGKATSAKKLDSKAVCACEDGDGTLWLATENAVYKKEKAGFTLYYDEVDGGAVRVMAAVGSGRLYTANHRELRGLHGKRPRWAGISPDVSDMPSTCVHDMAADSWGHIWIGTDKGVCIYDAQRTWFTYENIIHLPEGNIKKIVIGENGARYYGTDLGLIIQNGVHESFLGAELWLPDDEVTAIAASGDGNILWVGTKKGVSRIVTTMMTLSEKAAHYQDMMEKYQIREGFAVVRKLTVKNDVTSGGVEISDNDGLWTACYAAAQSLRYAVTGEEEAIELARRSVRAMLRLNYVTGIPGFPARSYRRPGELRYGDGDIEWHKASDDTGELEWKGETSSDEVMGHFFGLCYYYDLCADEEEKREIAAALQAIADHILEHDYTLCDTDGLPATWSHWGPGELNESDIWFWEKRINSFELLCILRVVHKMTGDEKYDAAYRDLVTNHHYALNSMQHKLDDAHDNHIDDHLGFLTSAVILRYEDDPMMRQFYLLALRHHWNYERIERCPYWNLIYGAFSGDTCDIDVTVKSMRELPLDFVKHSVRNSKRPGLVWDDGAEYFGGGRQLKSPLPYDEKPVGMYDCNPFRADGGDGGMSLEFGCVYLLPYWFGRYYGLIGED